MSEEQTTQSISFTINDGTAPINGASVVIGGVTKTTGSAGGCTFDNIEEGTVSVEVSKEGFTSKTEEISRKFKEAGRCAEILMQVTPFVFATSARTAATVQ